MTPEKCSGRKFTKIFVPNRKEDYCICAMGKNGEPPEICPKDCRWAIDLKNIWEYNPWT
jgi:hypothetical protein